MNYPKIRHYEKAHRHNEFWRQVRLHRADRARRKRAERRARRRTRSGRGQPKIKR